jgi:hypothetical protein
MEKLKKVENISSAAEGFVFDYDGHTYKFTGNFAPINQILGLFKYGRKGIPPLEKLSEQKEEEAKKAVFVWPGRFQPMGRHHYEVFKKLQSDHGSDSVFIATSDAKTSKKSPLNFEEKKKIMLKHGVPEDKILKVSRMYRTEELEDYFSPDNDIITFIVGKKDEQRLSSDHYSSYEKNKDKLETFDSKVYLKIAPHVSIKLPNGEEMSGSTLRDAMRNLTPESFEEAMGWFDKDIYEMLKGKINESVTSLSETIFSIINEVYSEKQRKWACAQIDNPGDLTKAEAEEMCYSKGLKKEKDELEELRTNISGFYGNPPDRKKKRYSEPALQDDYDTGDDEAEQPSEDSDLDFDEIEEISSMAGGSVGGYSLPLGMKPKYFSSPMPKVKGINIYNGKKKK